MASKIINLINITKYTSVIYGSTIGLYRKYNNCHIGFDGVMIGLCLSSTMTLILVKFNNELTRLYLYLMIQYKYNYTHKYGYIKKQYLDLILEFEYNHNIKMKNIRMII